MEHLRNKPHSRLGAASFAVAVFCAVIWASMFFINSHYGETGFNVPVVYSVLLLLLTIPAVCFGVAALFQTGVNRLYASLGLIVGIPASIGIIHDIYIFLLAIGAL